MTYLYFWAGNFISLSHSPQRETKCWKLAQGHYLFIAQGLNFQAANTHTHNQMTAMKCFPPSSPPSLRAPMPTKHNQVHDALLVATWVGGVLANVAALITHADIVDLDWSGRQVGGVDQEADPASDGRVRVVWRKAGVQYSDVCPGSILWLVNPRDLQTEGGSCCKGMSSSAATSSAEGNF